MIPAGALPFVIKLNYASAVRFRIRELWPSDNRFSILCGHRTRRFAPNVLRTISVSLDDGGFHLPPPCVTVAPVFVVSKENRHVYCFADYAPFSSGHLERGPKDVHNVCT